MSLLEEARLLVRVCVQIAYQSVVLLEGGLFLSQGNSRQTLFISEYHTHGEMMADPLWS